MPDEKPNWLAVRTAYIVKGWSASKCSSEFGIFVGTIKKRAAKEGWNGLRSPRGTGTDEIGTVVGAAAIERAKTDRAITEKLRALVDDSIADLNQITDHAAKITARNQIMLMGQRFLTVNRVVQGIIPGQPSDTGELDAPQPPDTAATTDAAGLEGEGGPAPARRFIVTVHKPLALVTDTQAAG